MHYHERATRTAISSAGLALSQSEMEEVIVVAPLLLEGRCTAQVPEISVEIVGGRAIGAPSHGAGLLQRMLDDGLLQWKTKGGFSPEREPKGPSGRRVRGFLWMTPLCIERHREALLACLMPDPNVRQADEGQAFRVLWKSAGGQGEPSLVRPPAGP